MAHDYKNHARPKKKKNSFPTGLFVLAILLVGLFSGFLFFLQDDATDVTVQKATKTPPVKKSVEKKKPVEPSYTFYELLPQDSSDLFKQDTPNTSKPSVRYFLQAGSFKTYAKADQLKAQLAFTGIISQIKTVTSKGKTWHRVQAGPYSDNQALDNAKDKLQALNIEPILIKKQ